VKKFTEVLATAIALLLFTAFLIWCGYSTILTIDVVVDMILNELTPHQIVKVIIFDFVSFLGISWIIVEHEQEQKEQEKKEHEQRQITWNDLFGNGNRRK